MDVFYYYERDDGPEITMVVPDVDEGILAKTHTKDVIYFYARLVTDEDPFVPARGEDLDVREDVAVAIDTGPKEDHL